MFQQCKKLTKEHCLLLVDISCMPVSLPVKNASSNRLIDLLDLFHLLSQCKMLKFIYSTNKTEIWKKKITYSTC